MLMTQLNVRRRDEVRFDESDLRGDLVKECWTN